MNILKKLVKKLQRSKQINGGTITNPDELFTEYTSFEIDQNDSTYTIHLLFTDDISEEIKIKIFNWIKDAYNIGIIPKVTAFKVISEFGVAVNLEDLPENNTNFFIGDID